MKAALKKKLQRSEKMRQGTYHLVFFKLNTISLAKMLRESFFLKTISNPYLTTGRAEKETGVQLLSTPILTH
jgi:hypothetical protein